MQIDRLEETRLTAQDEGQIAALMARAFPTEFNGRSYFHQRHHIRLVVHAPHIIGHMALTFRDIRIADALIPIIGLAEVATDPDHRGKGIAGALLEAAIAEARASLATHMLLFGDAKLYAATGFRPVHNKMRYVVIHNARTLRTQTANADSLMVLHLRDLPWPDGADLDMLGHLF